MHDEALFYTMPTRTSIEKCQCDIAEPYRARRPRAAGPSRERRGARPPGEPTSAGRHHDRIDRNDRRSIRPEDAKRQGAERSELRPLPPRRGAARRARDGAKRGQQLAVGGAEVHRGQLRERDPHDLLMLLGDGDGAGADGARDEDKADRFFGVAVDRKSRKIFSPILQLQFT